MTARVRVTLHLKAEAKAALYEEARDHRTSTSAVVEELLRWSRFEAPSRDDIDFGPVYSQHHEKVLGVVDVEAAPPDPKPPELRDPLAPDAPAWVQAAAARATMPGGLPPPQATLLKAWMQGEDVTRSEVLALPGGPSGDVQGPAWPVVEVTRAQASATFPGAGTPPAEPRVDAAGPVDAPAPVAPPAPPADLTAGMTDTLKPFDPEDPLWTPAPAYVPPPTTRTYLDKDAPDWARDVGEAIVEGAVPDGDPALEMLGRWMRGQDVPTPKGWPRASAEVAK